MHQGRHKCQLKPDCNSQLEYAQEQTLNGDLWKSPRELKINLIGYYLAQGDIEKVKEVAEKTDDYRVIEKLQYIGKDGGQPLVREDEVDSFKNIKSLKDTTDKNDILHIAKLNCCAVFNTPSYVFKTSRKSMEIALKMEQKMDSDEHAPNSLSGEYAYFDGMHSRVRGYKTLTLWVYHPGMCKVVLLAVMETESENTDMVTLFFNLFNQCLQELTGNNSYSFTPYRFMVDEAGANSNAIQAVFGKEMNISPYSFLPMAFQGMHKTPLPSILPEDQNTFIEMIGKLCKTYVRSEYIQVVAVLVEI